MASRENLKVSTWAICIGAMAAFAGPVAVADEVANFYRGKNITVYVGSSVGGGYDQYARLLMRHMVKHIPGNPNMIGSNMQGGGSIRATNFLFNAAPRDGLHLAAVQRGIAFEPLFGAEGAQYDATKFNWIGSSNQEVSVTVAWHDKGFKTIDDARQREMVIGASGAAGADAIYATAMNELLGTKFKTVTGYPGAQINLAIERGELDGRTGWSWSSIKSSHPSWIAEKKINLLVQLALEKHPELPDVPLVMDIARSNADRQVLEVLLSSQIMGRPYIAPPGVPAGRVEALRTAFDATMKDEDFLADAKKQKMEIDPVSGAAIEKIIARVYGAPKDVIDRANAILGTRRN